MNATVTIELYLTVGKDFQVVDTINISNLAVILIAPK